MQGGPLCLARLGWKALLEVSRTPSRPVWWAKTWTPFCANSNLARVRKSATIKAASEIYESTFSGWCLATPQFSVHTHSVNEKGSVADRPTLVAGFPVL